MFGIFKKFKEGLINTQKKLFSGFGKGIWQQGSALSNDAYSALEANLYAADFGPEAVEALLKEIKKAKSKEKASTALEIVAADVIRRSLVGSEGIVTFTGQKPEVVLLLGVNGAGKTTTAAKLAFALKNEGKRTLLGSCDTFRAAANEQLKVWVERLRLDYVASHKDADAASVAYDTCSAGIHRQCDVVLLDTAGRLHNKGHLLEELKKIARVLKKFRPDFPQHKWLVMDGSLGTNSITQAKLFHEAVGLTGIVVTKLDGTSKGGAIVGIYRELKLPIYFVGLGEAAEDLQPFSIDLYVRALFGETNT